MYADECGLLVLTASLTSAPLFLSEAKTLTLFKCFRIAQNKNKKARKKHGKRYVCHEQ